MNVPLLMVVGSSQNKTVVKGEVSRQTKQWLSLSSYCKKIMKGLESVEDFGAILYVWLGLNMLEVSRIAGASRVEL